MYELYLLCLVSYVLNVLMNRQGPAATVGVVRKLVQNAGAPYAEDTGKAVVEGSDPITEEAQADVAAQVADTAEKLDGDTVI